MPLASGEPLRRSRRVAGRGTDVADGTAARVLKPHNGIGPSKSLLQGSKLVRSPKEPGVRAGGRRVSTGPTRDHEAVQWAKGHRRVAGVDEAGRGPLAGPVVAAACIIPPDVTIPGLDDSKVMSEEGRETAYDLLTQHPAVEWAVAVVPVEVIDGINILQAALKAMVEAVDALPAGYPDYVLVDGNRLPKDMDRERSAAIIKGDSKSIPIAAASILAKVTRDRLMVSLHQQHPEYGFDQHKGYGVPAHIAAIRQHGPCPAHRRTFAPVKTWWPVAKGAEAAKA
ncbi:hypothetical protein ACKKBF_B03035 [Auxenochlorella protothecoides x Auxenochlorella symbiontica]